MWECLATRWLEEEVAWSCPACNQAVALADESLFGKITIGEKCSCMGDHSPTMREVAMAVLKEALLLFTTSNLNVVPSKGQLKQGWNQLIPSVLMEILLSPHDRWLKGLCSSSWTHINRNSQLPTSLGVRQKSISIHCSCGDLINSYLSLTPVPGLILNGTGANYSEKNVQLIIERFKLLV